MHLIRHVKMEIQLKDVLMISEHPAFTDTHGADGR